MKPLNTDTGLGFVTRSTASAYLHTPAVSKAAARPRSLLSRRPSIATMAQAAATTSDRSPGSPSRLSRRGGGLRRCRC